MIDQLFEISFEVCNKVGGIYTVLRTKVPTLRKHVHSYTAIGPYFPNQAHNEFTLLLTPSHLIQAFERAKSRGVIAHYGKWNIESEPNCILIDFSQLFSQKDFFKKELWDHFGIDSLNTEFEFDEPVTFSLATGILLEEIAKESSKKIIIHSHEWMTGIVNLYLRIHKANVRTIFTTHATMLGRSLASRGIDLTTHLKDINPEQSAKEVNVFAKFSTERACAIHSDVFTTVSEVTAQECEHFFGKRPVVVENGISLFPSFEQNAITHIHWKKRIHEFIRYFFFPYEQFDLDQTTLLFTSGRYEFKNKGLDLTIQALAELNEKLKAERSQKTVVFFFFVPLKTYGLNKVIAEQKLQFRHMTHLIAHQLKSLSENVVDNVLADKQTSVLDTKTALELKRLATRFKREGNTPLSTHEINSNDDILQNCLKSGLDNKSDDRVKVVIYPLYLDGSDGLLDGTYYDITSGCHAGLFLSSYEPWGYTPVECAACSVPALTTTCAGFGQYINSITQKREGIFVLDRAKRSDEDIKQDTVRILHEFVHLSHHQRVKQKVTAKLLTESLEWDNIIKKYLDVYTDGN